MKIILWFLKPYKFGISLVSIFLLICAIIETASIGAFYPLLTNVLAVDGNQVKGGGKILESIGYIVKHLPIAEEIIAASIFLFILVTGAALFGFFAEGFATWYRYKLFEDFLNRVYHKILKNHYSFFLDKKQGELLYIGINASQSVGEMLLYFPKAGIELFRLAVIAVFLMTISIKATVTVFIIMLLFGMFIRVLSINIVYPIAVALQNAQSELTAVFSESISGIKQIKIFDNLSFWLNIFKEQSYRGRMLSTRNVLYTDLPKRLIVVVGFFSIVFSIIYVKLYNPTQFKSVLPIIGVYIIALQRIMPSISIVGSYWMGLKGLYPRLEVTYNTLNDREYLIEDGGKGFTGISDGIRLEDISFSYPARRNVLKSITIDIPKAKTVAIIGESGAGKSTLADLLLRLYEPELGRILVDGLDYTEFSRSSWLNRVGMVSQDTFIFHASIEENIRIGKPDATFEEIVNSAKIAHAHQFILELPDGYKTIVGDRGVKLSGGQRQRIAIARAVIRDPDILILDEATSSLDNISEKVFQDALWEAKGNKTTIIIAHRLSTVEHADRIIALRNGEIIEQGTHEELLGFRGYYYSLYRKQKEE